ncbi:MAG TPA: hypothetical protein PKN33_11110 [Phycisphaerae bacterium]|nr:hypothetical protein [Phycisphaerae bacterium]
MSVMGISKSVILELHREMARLRKQADQIDDFLRTLAEETPIKTGVNAEKREPTADLHKSNGTFANRVRNALDNIGRTVQSRELAEFMIANGEPATKRGRQLAQVVAVELFRMSNRSGSGVRKVSRGRYRSEEERAAEA